ncbi:hypothetical protein [Polaribacter sp. SA4-12]|uniref:hypothetical protein n=1 Tax=Polaribacter sp. SA4-12 TaxID=1312072 RepID=UPI000B3C6BEE|nr:hypothetical protein [Polaribacter sp. SA4-12]ARV14318.1 hypothetical protein BTO07_03740 [Polaribacter sp. SA4-12]
MKKLNLLLAITMIALSTMSFTVNEEKIASDDYLKIEIPLTEIDSQGWGNWNTTDCLRGLDFRVKNDGYNKYAKKYRWSIQFRNRYKQKIHFSYKAVSPNEKYEIKQSGKTTDRIHVDGNNGTKGSYYLVKSGSSIYVYVNKIRIGAKDYGYDYYNCDN